MHLKRPWQYISRDMNWQGVMVGLVVLGLLILAILGSTTAGYVGAAVIVVSAVSLRATAGRRGCGHSWPRCCLSSLASVSRAPAPTLAFTREQWSAARRSTG
jgi:hypothetical protein